MKQRIEDTLDVESLTVPPRVFDVENATEWDLFEDEYEGQLYGRVQSMLIAKDYEQVGVYSLAYL